MLVSRLFRILFCATLLVCPIAGCGGVDETPATEEAPDEGASSTDGMTEEEAADFEEGEGG